jgi:hypothetical protein
LAFGLAGVFWAQDARAQVSVTVGYVAAPFGGGDPSPSESVTLGWQPKAVIFFWTKQTSTGVPTYSVGASSGYGFASCGVPPTCTLPGQASERAIAYVSDDGMSSNNAKSYQSESRSIVILTSAASPTPDVEAQLESMDATGFTIKWLNRASSGWIVHYMAIGGGDIADATVGTFTPSSGTGLETITGVGFEPDFMIFLSIDTEAGITEVLDSAVNHGKAAIGFAGRDGAETITQGATTAV